VGTTLVADASQTKVSGGGQIMRRQIAALSILAVAGGVGWKLSNRRETSARLDEIRLKQHSEHSQPGPTELAGIRVRIMPSDAQITAPTDRVPKIALAAE
jgi:hypothetical protein